jgi:hypothetical protein
MLSYQVITNYKHDMRVIQGLLFLYMIMFNNTNNTETIYTMDNQQDNKEAKPPNRLFGHKAVFGVGVALGVLTSPMIVPTALATVGFTSAGVVGGSVAAGMQASIGNVVAGSAFAVCQSIAMGGSIPTAVSAVSGVTTGTIGYIGSRLLRRQNKTEIASKL